MQNGVGLQSQKHNGHFGFPDQPHPQTHQLLGAFLCSVLLVTRKKKKQQQRDIEERKATQFLGSTRKCLSEKLEIFYSTE